MTRARCCTSRRCLLLATYYFPLAACYLTRSTDCSLFTTQSLTRVLLTAHCSLRTAHCALRTAHCSLLTMYEQAMLAVDSGTTTTGVRGAAQREFERFLAEYDSDRNFAGMRRPGCWDAVVSSKLSMVVVGDQWSVGSGQWAVGSACMEGSPPACMQGSPPACMQASRPGRGCMLDGTDGRHRDRGGAGGTGRRAGA